ncbi:MAG TPA: DUF6443 domain-containing protein [Flavisolibacter sp.]|nr:DUF6443 domain-containing protein [Flavisolibacter sp.]
MKPSTKDKLRLLLLTLLSFMGGNLVAKAQNWNSNHAIGTIDGAYHFSYTQTPSQLVELRPAAFPNTGLVYQWEQSLEPTAGFTSIVGGTGSSYSFSAPLTQTTYFRRRTMNPLNWHGIYSNVIKVSLVSSTWEDINYIREYDVAVTGAYIAQQVDALSIGQKFQTTTYLDGLGRPVEKVSREVATPASGSSLWGDVVSFSQYDAYGKQPVSYLPYTTTTQSGKFKTVPLSEQPQYYQAKFSETSAYASIIYDNSPLHRVLNFKKPGAAWAAGQGESLNYDLNDQVGDDVKIFSVSYVQGSAPTVSGVYSSQTLFKSVNTDENGKHVIEYIDNSGRSILRKVQLDDVPAGPYSGWMCTYFVYDDFGQLRYEISPEAVKYLSNNGWSFSGSAGTDVLNNLCHQYYYDEKGRQIWKKTPGAQPLRMVYDARDRLVFTQDGNQASMPVPQWTATVYDDLDRQLLSTLYNTSKSASTLKSDIAAAPIAADITIVGVAAGGNIFTISTNFCPLTYFDLNNSSVTSHLKFSFYDHYNWPITKVFNNGFTNASAYSFTDPNVEPIAASSRTRDLLTGTAVRILGSTNYLYATHYYDRRGSLVQTLSDNIKSGVDINTFQYHFDGRLLSSCADHTTAGTGYNNFRVLTKYLFDKIGRTTGVQKQFGASNPLKTIATYEFDDMGMLKVKRLDPGYTAGGNADLESLAYNYNIHGQLTGINKDYALKSPGTYSKWGHFFGQYIGYATTDGLFTQGRLNGQITGVVWNTQGDDAQRKYDYEYDNAGRLTKAVFTEQSHPGAGWNNTKTDFSVGGYTGRITYDLNGNLLSMLQKGVMPGSSAPITIDDLRYSYASNSGKLTAVTDWMTSTSVNGMFGDLKDGTNGSNPDYVYDGNGNLVIDLNKDAKDLGNVVGANGIRYNFLDKPDQIRLAGKGVINILYSGDGQKLQRTFTPDSGPASVTTYINQFTYQSTGGGPDALSFIQMEEGRVRVVTPIYQSNGYEELNVDGNIDLPNGKRGAFDYFILDYQQNIRMVLTQQTRMAASTASMEVTRAPVEEPIFGQTGGANEVAATRYPTSSTGWSGNSTASVSRLGNLAGRNIGPNTLQKVMAGDIVNARTDYYFNTPPSGSNPNFTNALLTSLLQALGTGPTSTLIKGTAGNVAGQLGVNPALVGYVQNTSTGTGGPLAYMTILFFDERFNFVEAQDGGAYQQQVASSVGTNGSSLILTGIRAPKNGYVYAYISNQSDGDVYFDNFSVSLVQGNIAEENHYYSFGLRIATLSSKKYSDSYDGGADNMYLMQGAYAEMDDDIGWHDFALRNYDAQTGRFVQQDPFQQFTSPYTGMGNDPVNLIDPSGGIGIPCPGTSALSIFLEGAMYAIGNALPAISRVTSVVSIASTATQTGTLMGNAFSTSNIINGQMQTDGIGQSHRDVNAPSSSPVSSVENSSVDQNPESSDFLNFSADDLNEDPCKEKFKSYDRTKDVESYNCAGLAFRTYRWMNLDEVEAIVKTHGKKTAQEGDIKVWLWTYDVHLELEDGTVASAKSSDFHIVGGRVQPGGKDPVDVYTKNGARPVFGPGKPLKWKPAAKDQARANNKSNAPQFYKGQKVMKVRTSMVQRIFILPCKSY